MGKPWTSAALSDDWFIYSLPALLTHLQTLTQLPPLPHHPLHEAALVALGSTAWGLVTALASCLAFSRITLIPPL